MRSAMRSFLGPAGIQVVELGEDPAVELAGDAGQLDERRVPDRIEYRRPDPLPHRKANLPWSSITCEEV